MAFPTAADADSDTVGWRWDNTYARLSAPLFASAEPAGASKPRVAILNRRLTGELGLNFDALSPDEAAAIFSGQTLPEGAQPIAQAYAGHQYGGFTMLGDGPPPWRRGRPRGPGLGR